ncbi:MAG TPA: HEPN domain-containing protein [Myxococcales bacterium]|nr:HEPN domain-containing protein [Myxococcales bacterium]
MARTLLSPARVAARDAEREAAEGAHGMAVRRCQEAVELALKALLRSGGVEVPRTHDVGPTLRKHAPLFAALTREELAKLVRLSRQLSRERAIAFYGDEEQGLGPDEIYGEDDSRAAIADAAHVLTVCDRLVSRG